MIMRLEANGLSYMLIGDLNRPGGKYLADRLGDRLHADVLQAPHHGAEGAAPNEFIQAVNPKHAFVSSFTELWCSKRSERIRKFLENNQTVTRVLGMQGDVMVRHFKNADPVWVEDRSRHMSCEEYLTGIFSQAVPERLLQSGDGEVLWHVDSAEMVSVAGYSALKLAGWAFVANDNMASAEISVVLINESTEELQVFDVKRLERPDVIEAHEDSSLTISQPGFEALLRADRLKDGNYDVWLTLTKSEATPDDKNGDLIVAVNTRRRLYVKNGNYELKAEHRVVGSK
jgi:hypothetical protein